MKLQNRRKWRIIGQYMIGWSLALIFLSIVRGEGTEEIGSVKFEMGKAILVSIIAGMIFGAISGYAQILTEERGYNRMSLQTLLLLRVVYVILFLTTLITLAYLLFGNDITYFEFAFEPGSFAIYLFIITTEVFMFGFRQINLFLGSNNLWDMFSGKFYNPREQERVFMFLDLESSTTHAERLGHITYSKLIQDCFSDLGVVAENAAEIYQYVGDEVILTWKLEDGIENSNCLEAYFKFKQQIKNRSEHYTNHYNCLPHFKAGVHAGIITVTQVGKYKKEIAYHGDTINTAARIQSKCNIFGKDLLISDYLKRLLSSESYYYEELGSIELRGKENKVPLFAVSLVTT